MPVGTVAGAVAATAAAAAAVLALAAGPAVAAPGAEPPADETQAPRELYPCADDGWPWSCVAQCESSGRWDVNAGNGYYGGLQFWQPTWDEHGGRAFAARADLATRDEQIEIARRVLVSQGWGAWPVCSKRYGLVGKEPGRGPEAEPVEERDGEPAEEADGEPAEASHDEQVAEQDAEQAAEQAGDEDGARVTGDLRAGRERDRPGSPTWLTMSELFRHKVVNAPNPGVLPSVYSGVRRTAGD